VGDDDQSIYKFRGATIENILSFEEQFPGAAVIRLEQNYRSTQNILSAANTVLANNQGRKGKNLWTDSGDGGKVKIVRLRDETEESRLIADTILENVRAGSKFGDHAVLYRMNAQSSAVERALARNAVPYRIVGGLRFYERKEIKDVVAYLSILANPGDNLRLLRIINEPKRGIGGATMEAAQEIAAGLGISLFDVIATADEYAPLAKKAKPLQDFAAMLKQLAEAAEMIPLPELLDRLLEETGYIRMLELQGFEGVGRIENVMELKTNIMKFAQESEEPTLSGFLEEISLYTDLDNYDQDADAVVLMTVHSAKGLEFGNVFIVGMDEGIFPGRSAINFPEELEEERRLAYVAITRAKRTLTITGAQKRLIFGQTIWSRPSRFTTEIPAELVENEDKTLVSKEQTAAAPAARRRGVTETSSSIGIGSGSGAAKQAPTAVIAAGDEVEHKVFGKGKVLTAKPMAGDTLLEIQFDRVGVKKVMANFARLVKL
jgi:DNA helicase-2/ATP-dependent DNA helicase PcrA